jgi:HAD superfamily hydrolase (TIGR01450 family)
MRKTVRPKVVLCDLDGVVWLAHQPIPGSVGAIASLREAGIRVVFVTNNSFSTYDEQVAALGSIGVPAEGDIVTSAMSAATAIKSGWRVLLCGSRGLIEEIGRVADDVVVAYNEPMAAGDFDAVVVGFHREFNYQVLTDALTAVRGGAVLIGSNDDPTYPTPNGPIPGGGSILAAIEKASGVTPTVTGKPYEPMALLVRDMCGDVLPEEMVMIGDRSDTDGGFARTMGARFAMVLSGVMPTADGSEADIVAPDLAGVVEILLKE